MKMPVTIGQKKAKLIEQLLDEMGVGTYVNTDDIGDGMWTLMIWELICGH